uniref:Integrase catalytic domain-containing protein n=1 Tax=Mycena chlorophos TaxID=658473 RepID=A0ABQ0L054_MYCCL|nr:predicted protein [Mycena chlorophos]
MDSTDVRPSSPRRRLERPGPSGERKGAREAGAVVEYAVGFSLGFEDLTGLGQGEEMAVLVELGEGEKPMIRQVYRPPGGKMTPGKTLEAYLAASKAESQAFEKDQRAGALFESFQQGRVEDVGGVPHAVLANVVKERGGRGGHPTAIGEEGRQERAARTRHDDGAEGRRCACCQSIDFICPPEDRPDATATVSAFAGKKYKPVGLKVRPVYTELPDKYRIRREIKGDPLAEMPELSPNPPKYRERSTRYTRERMLDMERRHAGFLLRKELDLLHEFIYQHRDAFAWEDSERGSFRHDFFPPIEFPVIEHEAWVERSIPIPRGQLEEFCRTIKKKIEAGVYEPSNASYRSKFFGVVKKDGKSIRLVHALEPLNAVTIAHSGLPPATEELANHFAGRACGGCLDLYSGYDHRDIAEASRDFTTFQTPFGALRLVKLPMGWTNSVPIFHDDVTFILQDEIPHTTIPYIDDVPIRGPGTRYEDEEGKPEMIPENDGIRRFVWEHFGNLNRVVQRVRYCGGTFSGAKSILCAAEFHVVGHLCSFEGRRADEDRVGVIERWGPLKDVSDVRRFLGTVGVLRMFIKDYALLARPIQKLTRADVEFEWGEAQETAMAKLKEALVNAPCLKPLNYEWDSDIVMAVDTSWMAVGIQIYQCDPADPRKRYYAKFASIPLNRREAEFSQPKRELYGLKRALEAMQYWLLGCRRLVVETDAKYIQGMLNNPGMGPNATINRWIEQILMFQFKLKHVKGAAFPPDGLSRREAQPGDQEWPPDLDDFEPSEPPEKHAGWDYFAEQPLHFEEFKEDIDTRGGYLQTMAGVAQGVGDLEVELEKARAEENTVRTRVEAEYVSANVLMPSFLQTAPPEDKLMPTLDFRDEEGVREPYATEHRSVGARRQDERMPMVRRWLEDTLTRPAGMDNDELAYKRFVKIASRFFLSKDGKLYRRGRDSMHQLVVEPAHRMYMMRAAHDALGHRGAFATKSLLEVRFWWPDLEGDVRWYIKTCHLCQKRKLALIRAPPVVTATPAVFQKIHTDVMYMSEKSNGCNFIVDARCALTRYPEARGIREQNAKSIGMFLLEDVICRWGCPRWIVTDNGAPFLAAVKWLEAKYGIIGIRISPYNSQANGVIERGHWDIRQSMFKATGGDLRRWYWFLHQVLWADRVTTRRGMGCSPFFAVTGSHPILPLDVAEATWLAEYPDHLLTTDELVGLRAKALAKHATHVEEMRSRVMEEKRQSVAEYARKYQHVIRDYAFGPGDVVLIRNTVDEESLSARNRERWWGPVVVVRRTQGGAYIVCEFNGAVWQKKIGQFRVIPYEQRQKLTLGPRIEELLDVGKETLDALEREPEDELEYHGPDFQFEGLTLRRGTEVDEDDGTASPVGVSEGEDDNETQLGESAQLDEDDAELDEMNPGLRRSGRAPKPRRRQW